MRAKLKIHCTVSVCVERAQKEETKIESGGRVGSAKAQTLPSAPLLSSFSSLYLPVSLSLSRSRSWAVQMKCGPHVGPWREGHGVVFSPCLSLNALHLTLCFNANDSFISSLLLTCATWQGSLCNLPITMDTGANQSVRWQKRRFYCLFIWPRSLWLRSTWHLWKAQWWNSAFHTCVFIFLDSFFVFFYECKALSLKPAGCSRDSLEQKEGDDDTTSFKNNITELYCFYSPMGKDQSRPTLTALPNGISVA